MKRLFAILLLVPAAALAQEPAVNPAEGIVVARPAAFRSAASGAAAEQTPATAAKPESGTRRRPSMVGYVEDSTIGTQFRLRFDSGFHIQNHDRAEFFYGKCGCYKSLLPTNHPFYDPNAPGPTGGIATDLNFQQLYILGEYGMMANRGSLFVELPVRWVKPQAGGFAAGSFGDTKGISDLRLGVKFGLMATNSGNATVLVRVSAPTGDAAKGLGTNHTSIEPALLVSRAFDKVGVEAEFGGVFPTDGSAGLPTAGSDKFSGRVLYYGVGPSFDLYSSNSVRFAPVIELVGWRVLSGFQTGNPSPGISGPNTAFADASKVSANIVNLKIGARVTMMRDKSSIYFGYGKHLTDASWYDDIFRVEYRVGLGR